MIGHWLLKISDTSPQSDHCADFSEEGSLDPGRNCPVGFWKANSLADVSTTSLGQEHIGTSSTYLLISYRNARHLDPNKESPS